jgi:long-chain acyl-CoA synthetase
MHAGRSRFLAPPGALVKEQSMNADRPWFAAYEPHVPPTLEYPNTTLPAALAVTAQKWPDVTAILFKGARISYRQHNQNVDRFAAALQKLGVKKGDRVAVHLPNCPQFIIAYYATLRIGGIVVPCNPIYTPRELEHQLRDSGAIVIITLSSTYGLVRSIRERTTVQRVIVAQIKTYFPPLLRLLFTLLMEKKSGHRADISGDATASWFTEVMASAPEKPTPVDIRPEDTAVLMYTGGTTGVSKGAELTHRNILVNAYQVIKWVNAEEGKESMLTALPLFHSYGMTCCMNPGALQAGTALLVPDPRDIKDILKTIHRYRPTFYPGVPAMYAAINNHPDATKYNLRSLKVCNSGAAPLPVDVQERFQKLTGARLIEGFGLSETSPVTHANPAYGQNRLGTIGIPYPDTDARIVDADTGDLVLGPNEIGELCIRGPQVMKAYWNRLDETARVLRNHADGTGPWLYTGDLALMEPDGYFRIVDRKKDMILGAGGYNIYPREIDDVLFAHPKVREAASFGVLVPEKGEQVMALVVLKDGETATAEEIIAYCRENLAPYKVPRRVEFRAELPKTLVGKILRRALREEVAASQSSGGKPA